MSYLFYVWAIVAIIYESMVLKDTKRVLNFSKRMEDLQWSEYSDTQKNFSIMNMLYFLWVCVGFLSEQWWVFVAMLVLCFIPTKTIFLKKIDALLTLILLIFALVNHFHLHL